jgi:hypothetical protein
MRQLKEKIINDFIHKIERNHKKKKIEILLHCKSAVFYGIKKNNDKIFRAK